MVAFRTLRIRDTHPQVQTLKRILNEVLHPSPFLVVDSSFDDATDRAVRRFQRDNAPPEDGIVGPITWRKLIAKSGNAAGVIGDTANTTTNSTDAGAPLSESVDAGTSAGNAVGLPETSGLSDEHKHNLYLNYIRRATSGGATAISDLEVGKRVILGLRVTTSSRAASGGGTYDDRIIVLHNNAGVKTAREFAGNTDPSSRYEDGYEHARKSLGEDANSDGRLDLGRMPEGVYEFRKERSGTYGNILRPTSAIIAERDTNHDGAFNASDTVTNRAALSSGQTMLFHKGGNSITGSAGCQTMPPATFERFWEALGSQRQFRYVLVKVQ